MKRFAVAFATTGNSPKDGHRFSGIVVVGDENGTANGEGLSFRMAGSDEVKDVVTFSVALVAMKSLIGDSPIVVHDAGKWRRFLRAELRLIKRHGAANLMNNVVDVSAWAHQRFPRQRKDVAAIARRVGVEIPDDMGGLALEAELLRRIGRLISVQKDSTDHINSFSEIPSMVEIGPIRVTRMIDWAERVGRYWRTLMGRS
jgi:hypothetical protein